MRPFRLAMTMMLGAALLAGCGIPRDPDGTLSRIRESGVVVVGAIAAPPVLVIENGEVSGPEADLITGWADKQGAAVRWVEGGDEQSVTRLQKGDVDLVVGGLSKKTPWSNKVGLSRPWTTDEDEYGRKVDRVVAVPLGENALLSSIEAHIDEGKK